MNYWIFTLDDGSKVKAKFTDEEIREFEKQHPEVNWIWNDVQKNEP